MFFVDFQLTMWVQTLAAMPRWRKPKNYLSPRGSAPGFFFPASITSSCHSLLLVIAVGKVPIIVPTFAGGQGG